ncbi:hypothetical protein FOA43_001894 [Brettanomyces nanus]|uniref:Uncharacterized protein n=1 Tax=Eeniella nana TaxID=13502 RepID=A0A875S0X6_EENNA|nr:uncharacterized protein FOA43_001894 [Brettanomyces nanus]QPG74563.1 hypothetical protein FOA43_001894 [Brettanomyces nanus]
MAKSSVNEEQLRSESHDLFIVVASVPTLARSSERLEKFDPAQFRAIIVDECHHAVSKSYLKIFKWFGCDKGEAKSPFLLGFSATLQRHDKKPLRRVFDEIVYEKSMIELVDEGYLVDCDWKMVEARFNLSSVEVGYDGDYKLNSLAKHVDTDDINELALKTYKFFERKRKLQSTLIFCCNVEHMENLGRLFRINGIEAQYVTGNTKMFERSHIVDDFKSGDIKVLINCGVFTEGTNLPNIDSIMLLRPTKSQPLLTQMVGRGLRLHEGKDKCLVVDFVESKDTGLSLSGDLGGVNVENSIGSLFSAYDGGHQGRGLDEPLEKQPDYIEFRTFEGFKDLVKNWEKENETSGKRIQNDVYQRLISAKDAWIQTRQDSWALKMNDNHYYRIDVDRKRQIVKLIYVSMVAKMNSAILNGKGRYVRIPYNKEIMESDNVEEVLKKMKQEMEENGTKKEMYEAENNRRFFFGKGKITKKQYTFLMGAMEGTVNPSKHCRVDLDKFKEAVGKELQALSKFEASNLIFAYTISRRKALEVWATKKVLSSREKRRKVMKITSITYGRI